MMAVRISGGRSKGRTLKVGRRSTVRPTTGFVRSSLFSILNPYLADTKILDLFAGSGALGIESLSRGAAHTDFVEVNSEQCRVLRENLRELSLLDRATVYRGRVEQIIMRLVGKYDIIFMDPPYQRDSLDGLVEKITERGLLAANGKVVVERPREFIPSPIWGRLSLARQRGYGNTIISIYEDSEGLW